VLKSVPRPSAALLVAFVALLIALGGTSYAVIRLPANSVGAKQLKKNAVTAAKVKDASLLRADFKAGQLPAGPAGPQGAPGSRGPAGPAGPAGPSGATKVTVREGASAAPTSVADCEPGERAVGGGGFTADGALYESAPSATSGTPTDWVASAQTASGADAQVQAWVICAAP